MSNLVLGVKWATSLSWDKPHPPTPSPQRRGGDYDAPRRCGEGRHSPGESGLS